jgi:hypothetical protein
LGVVAVLRAARSVFEVGPAVAPGGDRGRQVVGIHDRFDEDQRVVRCFQGFAQVRWGLGDERLRGGVRAEYLLQMIGSPGPLAGLAALPAALGVAILRYRLYDIDRLISRTLAYAIITGLLVGV